MIVPFRLLSIGKHLSIMACCANKLSHRIL